MTSSTLTPVAVRDAECAEAVPPSAEVRATESMTSVSKALKVLACFDEAAGPIGVSELARRAGVHKSTAFRLLSFLQEAGFVERDERNYQLGTRTLQLGRLAGRRRYSPLRSAAMPHMTELATTARAIVHLAVVEHEDSMLLDKLFGPDMADAARLVPPQSPLNCSAAGKVLLAFGAPELAESVLGSPLRGATPRSIDSAEKLSEQLRHIKVSGLGFDINEAAMGLGSIAVPVVGDDGLAHGAISLVVPTFRLKDAELPTRLKAVARAVGESYRRLTAP